MSRRPGPACCQAGLADPACPDGERPDVIRPRVSVSEPGGTGRGDSVADESVAALAGAENFPVALRLLPAAYRRHLMAVYVFARTVDDAGDEAPAADRLRLLDELEADVGLLYAAGGRAELAAVRGLAPTVTQCGIDAAALLDLIQANRQDQQVTRYQSFDDLLGYCRLSANPVGRMVLHVFGRFSADRAELSDRICTALQLAEHWQDVAEDLRMGRIYLPADDLAAHGCTEADLAAAHAGPHVRALLAAEVDRTRALLDSGAPLVGTLRGAARLAVAG